MALHPLDPITPDEVSVAATLLRSAFPTRTLEFRVIDINEPSKTAVLDYLAAEKNKTALPTVPRLVKSYFTHLGENVHFKAIVNLETRSIASMQQLPHGVQTPHNPILMAQLEDLCLQHPTIIKEIEKLKLPKGYTAICDPWIYGTDDPDEKRGLVQYYMYVQQNDHPETNHYSLPLKFSPVFDQATREFVRMDYLPSGLDEGFTETDVYKVYEAVEYHPELTGIATRPGLKPLIIQQPEGPSFTTKNNFVEWQGWTFRVGFNVREGLVLYNLTFKGHDLFYRVSLSEMTVPYGDPRRPFHRKQAFDLGDVGFGASANSLGLGCDCLGVIRYFDGVISDPQGNPIKRENVVCMHEQDDGILYKHLNYRNEMATVARQRVLILQTIATVANYEYIVEYILDQTGGIDIKVRATGILSTMPIDDDIVVPWGTIVGPGVVAAYHQHMLSFRLDTAIGGQKNTVMYQETVPLPRDERINPYTVGYISKPTYVDRSGAFDQNPLANREFKIINENKINPTTKKPLAYKIYMPTAQMLLADEDSYNSKRAKFASHPYWVTKYRDDELYAAGEFTNQSQQDTGLGVWANGQDAVRNEDIVLWPTMGFTHNPRPEDFPVMPVEIHMIHIRPSGFFDRNPALDIPKPSQATSKSVLVKNDSGSSSCCKI